MRKFLHVMNRGSLNPSDLGVHVLRLTLEFIYAREHLLFSEGCGRKNNKKNKKHVFPDNDMKNEKETRSKGPNKIAASLLLFKSSAFKAGQFCSRAIHIGRD